MKNFTLAVLLAVLLTGCDNSYNASAVTMRVAAYSCQPGTFTNQLTDDGNIITITITCKKNK